MTSVSLILSAILFWLVRIWYWSVTDEVPFSDIGDYVRIGQSVAESFDFRFSEFWATYKPPGIPLFLGIIFKIFGSDNLAWPRFFQTLVLFIALGWLLYELAKRSTPISVLILIAFSVAISKPSIFWSYKPATESLSEAFIYLNISAGLFLMRRKDTWAAIVLGFLVMYGILVRPQALLVLPAAIALPLFFQGQSVKKNVKLAAFIGLASLLTWLPWGIRNHLKYGGMVAFSTQGPYSFLWELGNVEIPDPENPSVKIVKNVNELQSEASEKFKTDFDAMNYASYFMNGWLKENRLLYLEIIGRRIAQTIKDRSEYLTKVSRIHLFDGPLDTILIDKTAALIITGLLGLAFAIFTLNPSWSWVLAVPLLQWLMGTLFLGYPRVIDPSIPGILFGNIIWIYYIGTKIKEKMGVLYASNRP